MESNDTFSYSLLELLDEAELRCLMEDLTPERLSSREPERMFVAT
jgi:hypothetical protein